MEELRRGKCPGLGKGCSGVSRIPRREQAHETRVTQIF